MGYHSLGSLAMDIFNDMKIKPNTKKIVYFEYKRMNICFHSLRL